MRNVLAHFQSDAELNGLGICALSVLEQIGQGISHVQSHIAVTYVDKGRQVKIVHVEIVELFFNVTTCLLNLGMGSNPISCVHANFGAEF
jgi:hypothetical protein